MLVAREEHFASCKHFKLLNKYVKSATWMLVFCVWVNACIHSEYLIKTNKAFLFSWILLCCKVVFSLEGGIFFINLHVLLFVCVVNFISCCWSGVLFYCSGYLRYYLLPCLQANVFHRRCGGQRLHQRISTRITKHGHGKCSENQKINLNAFIWIMLWIIWVMDVFKMNVNIKRKAISILYPV